MARVSWDEGKNYENQRKHGVSFKEAEELFSSGTDHLEIYDEPIRRSRIALSPSARLLVAWYLSSGQSVTRIRFSIISARWATRREQDLYYSYLEETL